MTQPQKAYNILKVYFKFSIGRWTWQLRKLEMLSDPMGETFVFTVSSKAHMTVDMFERLTKDTK